MIFTFLTFIGIGGVCAYIHKKKGYSAIAGFCWGAFFSVIGLLIVLSERTKEEQMEADKEGLTMFQWLGIFLVVGILLMVIIFFLGSLR